MWTKIGKEAFKLPQYFDYKTMNAVTSNLKLKINKYMTPQVFLLLHVCKAIIVRHVEFTDDSKSKPLKHIFFIAMKCSTMKIHNISFAPSNLKTSCPLVCFANCVHQITGPLKFPLLSPIMDSFYE